jgi:hypothetical protein
MMTQDAAMEITATINANQRIPLKRTIPTKARIVWEMERARMV